MNDLNPVSSEGFLSRRIFLGSLGALLLTCQLFGNEPQSGDVPATAIHHVRIRVSDLDRSLEWYQGLFGMPIVARHGDRAILRVGEGPQFLEMVGGSDAKPGIVGLGLSTDDFDPDRVLGILKARGVTPAQDPGPMKVQVEDRDEEPGGVADGAPEVIFGDPDGIVLQLQDSSFSGGVGPLGNEHPKAPEPAPTEGLLAVQDFNHITMFVSDQKRSVAFYRELFRMPVDTYQGALPILRVGAGNQFLALVSSPRLRSPAFIHHACFTVKDFDPDRILKGLAEYGVTPRGDKRKQAGPLRSYVTMRMPDRGGAPEGTPELYLTDPDGILLQIQDLRYAGGSGYLGNERGKPRDAPK